MESVLQSITGSGIVYFPPTHHLLYLTVTIILSVLLSYTFRNSVSQHASFNKTAAYACARAQPLLLHCVFCLFVFIWMSAGVWFHMPEDKSPSC